MTTNSTAEIQEVSKAVKTLATHVLTLAKRVYAKDDDQMPYMDDDDEKKSKMSKTHEEGHDDDDDEDMKMSKRRNKMGDHDDDYDDMEDRKARKRSKMGDHDYDDDDDMSKRHSRKAEGNGGQDYESDSHQSAKVKTNKGFADSAEDRKDEEDASFGEAAGVDEKTGNEPLDPAKNPKSAPFADDRNDETFNVNAMMKQITKLASMVEKMEGSGAQTIVKSMVPGNGDRHDGREVGSGMVVTRDMQEQAKGRTYQELNRLREEMGDLPRHGFLS